MGGDGSRENQMKYKHLTLDDRIEIQKALKEGKSFVQIGSLLNRDASTIAKEIKSHISIRETGTKSRPYNQCTHRKNCLHQADICTECTRGYYWLNRENWCSLCDIGCNDKCKDYSQEECRKIRKPPYVCNGCSQLRSCTLRKKFYDAKEAQKTYEKLRSESRTGISLCEDEIKRVDDIISPLVKQGQSIHHICSNNADEIMLDERTIYNYIDYGLLSVGNLDLPRKVRYRKRKAKRTMRVDKKCHIGRSYEEFLEYMNEHPDTAYVEMDSVEGTKDSTKVLLTLIFKSCNFMIAFLRESNTARSVTDIFKYLDELLGRETFVKLFPVILADRGSEFTDPASIEVDEYGEIRTRVFYCDPQRPDQKGSIEVTHEFIRRVLPKKTSFSDLTQEKVNLMMNHINSYARKKLNNRPPLLLFSFLYGEDTADLLNAELINADRINLTPELLK